MGNDFEHIVIGAGISGLGLAHRTTRKGVETLVLERSERVGGCMSSQRFADCGEFWTEAGSHSCFNSYGHLLDTLGDLGMMDRITPKEKLRYSLWADGERKSVFSALHPLEMAVSLPRLFTADKADMRVVDYYGAGLGRRNYRDLIGPSIRAVICQEADDFPADLIFRRKPRRKEVARSFTIPGGLSGIPEAIAAQRGLEVRTGGAVTKVLQDRDGFRLRLQDGQEFTCRYLSLAVPPNVAAVLVPEGLGDLRAALQVIGVVEVESLILCVARDQLAHLPPLAGLIAVDDAFYSMVSRDYLPHGRYRGFAFHFRPGVLAHQAQVERACRALGIGEDRTAAHTRTVNRLPALRAGHQRLVGRIDAALAGGRLAITGNWFLGVSIEDCLTRSHQEYLRMFGS